MAGRQRKLDEKHQSALRELVGRPENKHCFDCGQRGPTYVDMTVGSFVCTGCSGILRGLNPPHRVKSISMATFTPDEMESIRQRGNAYCAQVWLGLYEGKDSRFDAFRDDAQIKDFLIMKYERKRWYVSPNEIARQQALLARHHSPSDGATTVSSAHGSSAGGSPAANGHVNAVKKPPQPQHSQSASGIAHGANRSNDIFELVDTSLPTNSSQPATGNNPPANTRSSKSDFDLLTGDDPFASQHRPAAVQQQYKPPANATSAAGFEANFAAFQPAAAPQQPVVNSNDPWAANFPAPAANRPINSGVAKPAESTPQAMQTGAANSADKYSALAELDSLFGAKDTPATQPNKPMAANQGAGGHPTTAGRPPIFGSQPTPQTPSQTFPPPQHQQHSLPPAYGVAAGLNRGNANAAFGPLGHNLPQGSGATGFGGAPASVASTSGNPFVAQPPVQPPVYSYGGAAGAGGDFAAAHHPPAHWPHQPATNANAPNANPFGAGANPTGAFPAPSAHQQQMQHQWGAGVPQPAGQQTGAPQWGQPMPVPMQPAPSGNFMQPSQQQQPVSWNPFLG